MLDLTHFMTLLVFIGLAGFGMAAIQDGTGKVLGQIIKYLPRRADNGHADIPASRILNRQSLHF